MDFKINDENFAAAQEHLTLTEALFLKGITNFQGVAVAVNHEVVPRNAWNSWSIKPNDHLLIITATQGG